MIRNSIKKSYISACSAGDLNRLQKMISISPYLLKVENEVGGSVNRNGIYYSIKSLSHDRTDFLLSMNLYTTQRNISNLISDHWRASPSSYVFLKKYGLSIFDTSSIPHPDKYYQWLYDRYKLFCIIHNSLSKLYEIMKFDLILNKESLSALLQEYLEAKKKSGHLSVGTAECVSNIRDLQLKILLYD